MYIYIYLYMYCMCVCYVCKTLNIFLWKWVKIFGEDPGKERSKKGMVWEFINYKMRERERKRWLFLFFIIENVFFLIFFLYIFIALWIERRDSGSKDQRERGWSIVDEHVDFFRLIIWILTRHYVWLGKPIIKKDIFFFSLFSKAHSFHSPLNST